jgi:hypothetical protein
MWIIRFAIAIFLSSATLDGYGQVDFLPAPDQLPTGAPLPEGLQSTRSAVLMKVSPVVSLDSVGWYNMAQVFHQALVDLHIDAVVYYRWRDLNSGFDASKSYIEALADREVNQCIILEVQRGSYQVYITASGTADQELFAANEQVWHLSGSTLESVIASLTQIVDRAGLEVANFLISETPEFFVDTPIFKKNRFESFQPDLKLDKLAVPMFIGRDPKGTEDPADLEIQAICKSQYPFEYEIVSAEMDEELMRKAGFQYVLRYLHAEESTLLTLLDYEFESPTPGRFAYKFYCKHLVTGDIYLGDSWDAQPTWQESLNLHLKGMKRSLKVE